LAYTIQQSEGDEFIYDHEFSIDRAKYSPFENYGEVVADPGNVFLDATFSPHKSLYWQHSRPTKDSHDLMKVLDKILHGWQRLVHFD
jgi:hypothetical protein